MKTVFLLALLGFTAIAVDASTFTVKTISSSSSVAGATNTISVTLKIDNAALAANDVITITMGANKFATADDAQFKLGGTDVMKFGGNTWVKATGVLTLNVAAGQSVAANTSIAITFDLTNVDAVQAALTPTVEGTIAAAGGSAIASSNMVVTGMDVVSTFTVKTISSSSSVAGATNTISVGLKIDNAALAGGDVIKITMGANKFATADDAQFKLGGTDVMKFGGNTWVKTTGVVTLKVAAGQSVAANTAIAITFDLTNVDAVQAALTPTVEGTIAAAGGSAIASSNMVVTGMNVDVTTTAAAAPTATTAAPTATTTVSGASSEAAWSTMLTVFAIAMAAFSTL